jgi:hypothetical protein
MAFCEIECIYGLPRDYLVRENTKNNTNKIALHTSYANIDDFNIYAKKSLEIDNDAKRRSKDEATSIHIITDKLNTRLNILYERQICEFYGKPDFIIRLGKNLYIMVSTTRAICHNNKSLQKDVGRSLYIQKPKIQINNFTQKNADRLMSKKLNGLSICKNNLECLVDEVINENHVVMPVLHILSPNKINTLMCIGAYNKILKENIINVNKIKVIISHIKNHEKLL